MHLRSVLTAALAFNLLRSSAAWLFNCKRAGFGAYTIQKNCRMENVFIDNATTLYRVFFPPVELEIYYGSIPDFNRAVASRMSSKTKRLTILYSKVEQIFLRDSLEYVELMHNAISEVEFDSAQHMKVWMLRLNYNLLRDASFVSDIKTLVILGLRNNLITTVSWNTFAKLKLLKTLDLGGNPIKQVDCSGDLKLPSLKRLILSENSITHFDLRSIVMNDLKEFNISSNQLLTLNTFQFERAFPSMEEVDLNNNPWNCGRQDTIQNLLMIKRIKRHKPTTTKRIVCHEDHLELMALSAPDGIDKLANSFNLTKSSHHNLLNMHNINTRLTNAHERISFLEQILIETSSATNDLLRKVNLLFKLNNLRTSRNINMRS
ncbi:leucine-rich repeats and immunoglobulin-like domains protein sma-10 [Ochlerotatus camptorhynchus]|uniref:leucine-rich repeats and immunoglobulin-like domains protein sma-10 n=1 Tax=Ochlerotatus camptorhynchus TaxID=644619 RepID=UPI0031CE44CB